MKSFKIGATLLLFSCAFFAAQSVHAQTDSDCAPQAADLQKIQAVQNDPTLTAAQELTQELSLRKSLVTQTIECSKSEVNAEKQALVKVSLGSDITNLQMELEGKLNDATNFYSIEESKLGTVGISGSEAVARELLAWREGSYEPLAAEANNFILWADNQNLFDTAKTRMDQTQRAVAFLENAGTNSDLQNALSAAQSSFAIAEQQNTDSQNALINFLPADQSLGIIKQSLDSLSDTYQKFSVVAGMINNLLSQ